MIAVLALAAAYLVGAIPTGYLVARAFGLADIRRQGSGSIGATNVLRTLGRAPAALTLLGDVVKGYLAVTAGSLIAGGAPGATAACAVAAVAGNCWPVFLRFRGGKGMATGLGALLALVLVATVPAAVVWVVIALTFRYASLASLTAAACVPLGVALLAIAAPWSGYGAAHLTATLAVAAIIAARHRENIARLLAGTEPRIGARSAA